MSGDGPLLELKQTIKAGPSSSPFGNRGVIYDDYKGAGKDHSGRQWCWKVYKKKTTSSRIQNEIRALKALNKVESGGTILAPKFSNYSEKILVTGQIHRGVKFEKFAGSDILDAVNDKKIQIINEKETVFLNFAFQILNILRKMHQVGVHRDIKLENCIVLDEKGKDGNYQFRVVDFDSFHFLGEDESRFPGGTATYFPPEKYHGCTTGSPSEDIWAVAIMIMVLMGDFYLINCIGMNSNKRKLRKSTAFFPDGSETTPETTEAIVQERLSRLNIFRTKQLRQKNRHYFDILASMLKVNPEERATAEELYNKLRIMRDERVECPPSPDSIAHSGVGGELEKESKEQEHSVVAEEVQ
jgi:serine/threonine protein kinase